MATLYPTLSAQVQTGTVDVSVTSAAGGAGQTVSYTGVTDSARVWNQDTNHKIEYQVGSGSWVSLDPNKEAVLDIDMSATTIKLRLSEFAPTGRAVQVIYNAKPHGVLVPDAEGRPATFDDVSIGQVVTIGASRDALATDNGKTLVFSAAYTYTMVPGLPEGFSVAVRPPASGNASIARTAPVTLNDGTSTLTRAQASNILFAVVYLGADTYAVTGS